LDQKKEGKMTTVVKDERIQIEKLELGPYGTNAYVLICRGTGESVAVDAPGVRRGKPRNY